MNSYGREIHSPDRCRDAFLRVRILQNNSRVIFIFSNRSCIMSASQSLELAMTFNAFGHESITVIGTRLSSYPKIVTHNSRLSGERRDPIRAFGRGATISSKDHGRIREKDGVCLPFLLFFQADFTGSNWIIHSQSDQDLQSHLF